jgi:hypothetical protein
MRSFLFKAALGIAISPLFLCSSAKAQDNDGCSIATLNGDYAFTVSGQIFLPTGAVVQREGIAMTHFDGAGGLTQVDLVESSPNAPPPSGVSPTDPVTGFHTHESGTYTVHADCTGTFTVNFHDMTNPMNGQSVSDQIIVVSFVLSDHGRAIHTVVTSLIPAGRATPANVLIRSDGHKLGSIARS